MPNKSAIEILVFKPNADISPDKRGVHENLWIKQRFQQYLSIGVYLDDSCLKYYFFENFYLTRETYDSLAELKKHLPIDLTDIFESTPKLFIMGHGRGDQYGLGNNSVEIYDEDFDKIVMHFTETLSVSHHDVIVTLEACNTDNLEQAVRGKKEKTFLERLSIKHPTITFCGTGPWNSKDPQTGYRASGGFPTLHAPITSMGGGIWKHGNSVIFYHGKYQVAVIKSMLASTETAKALKINTIEYAREALKNSDTREKILASICMRRDVLHIDDLEKIEEFKTVTADYQGAIVSQITIELVENERQIIAKEKNNYIERVKDILTRLKAGLPLADKDPLIIALSLKDLSVFIGHEDVRDEIFANQYLLQRVMISCGKVLVAGPSNDSIIDLLLSYEIDINSTDENGMSALHYAVQSFYNYRKEPLDLINKLLDCGANLNAKNDKQQTPLALASLHAQKETVAEGNLLLLLQQRLENVTSADAETEYSQMPTLEQPLLSPAISGTFSGSAPTLSSTPVYCTPSSSSSSYHPALFLTGAAERSFTKRSTPNEPNTEPEGRLIKEARRT